MIEQMRTDFPLAAKAERWSAEDQAEIGAAIKAAIDANDTEALAYWSGQIAEAAATWRAWCNRVRLAEARIKAGIEERRLAA